MDKLAADEQQATPAASDSPGCGDAPDLTGCDVVHIQRDRQEPRSSGRIDRQAGRRPAGVIEQQRSDTAVQDALTVRVALVNDKPAARAPIALTDIEHISDQPLRAGFVPDEIRPIHHDALSAIKRSR